MKDELRVNECPQLCSTYFKKGGVQSESRINQIVLSTVVKKWVSKIGSWKQRVLVITDETVDIFRMPASLNNVKVDQMILVKRFFYRNLRALIQCENQLIIHAAHQSGILLESNKASDIIETIKDQSSKIHFMNLPLYIIDSCPSLEIYLSKNSDQKPLPPDNVRRFQ